MADDQVETDAQVVREIAASAFVDAIEIMAIIETLEAGNQKSRIDAVNKAGAGRAAGHIERALFTRLHFLVSRGYSKSSRDGDMHARRAFDLLKKANVRSKITNAQSDADLSDAEARWVKCCGDHRLHPFLHFRDKYLAHLGEPDAGIPIPTYGEVLGLARDTARAFEKLAQGTGVVTLSLDSQIPAHKESASQFWSKWAVEPVAK